MRSPTYGELTFAQIAGKIASYIMGHGLDRQYELSNGVPGILFPSCQQTVLYQLK